MSTVCKQKQIHIIHHLPTLEVAPIADSGSFLVRVCGFLEYYQLDCLDILMLLCSVLEQSGPPSDNKTHAGSDHE